MTLAAYRLKPWNQVVRPHDDIVAGDLELSTYAADLAAVDRGDAGTPRVYRDPREFFRTTYPTKNLQQLLKDVLGVLAGGKGDRVIQLRTPFGGGKTHSLLALYHLVKSRAGIDPAHVVGLPDPGPGRVAVLSGIDLDPITPRVVDGLQIRTLWGELAYRLGGQLAYEKVREHDAQGKPPGGEVLRSIIGSGPVLILLDEVLVYVQRAGGRTGTDPQQRQVVNFLQGLTEVVRHLKNAALVYSLQASVHEAAGDEALLQELDHLVTRVDAKREPVSDEEVMRVVQRRLFPTFGDDPEHERVAREVAREYAIAHRRLREAFAETESERRSATQEAERFETRVLDSYPFHPALLDLMYHRWGSLPSYQRTRGALQFLARVVHGLWAGDRPTQPLISPGDVPLQDEHVRGAFFSQVGERERYSSVLAADIVGAAARCREVDRRIADDSPAFAQLRLGTRTATAIMLYSFGAREGEERGVLEGELLQGLVGPEIDRNVVTRALHDLREELLYLHHVGRRYRFEPKANLNLLISEESKKWSTDEVLERVKKGLARMLAPAKEHAVLWPPDSGAIPDVALFQIVYLGHRSAGIEGEELQARATSLVERHGAGPRTSRNGLALAVPDRGAFDRARIAARTLQALEALLDQAKSKRLSIEPEQVAELADRQRGAAADFTGALERLYELVLIPVASRDSGNPFRFEMVDLRAQLSGGRDLQTRLLDSLRKHVFDRITPARLTTITRLGETRDFVACEELVSWFFSYFDFPKLMDDTPIRRAISDGTADHFGYVSAARVQDARLIPARRELVRFGASTAIDEVDLGPACFLLSPRLAQELRGDTQIAQPEPPVLPPETSLSPTRPLSPDRDEPTHYHLRYEADAVQLFRTLPALQNLSEKASDFKATVDLKVAAEEPFDRTWLRNAVEEHLDEAGVEAKQELG